MIFYVPLKKGLSRLCVRFSFLTGITRYGLSRLDKDPNHYSTYYLDAAILLAIAADNFIG
jgi:hypothetical protein